MVDINNIKSSILQDFRKGLVFRASQLTEKYKISRQALHKHLSSLIKEGLIIKLGSSRKTAYYALNTGKARLKVFGRKREFCKRVRAEGFHEDSLLKDIKAQAGFLDGLTGDAKTNFDYAFTEMVNNAIDHSQTRFIDIKVNVDAALISFSVSDTGVGIFKNICEKKNLASEMEAIQDLIKGKQTTMPERHTGEGIFFTSKIADRFVIESHQKRLTIDNEINDIFIEDIRFKTGTRVFFSQKIDTEKNLPKLFHQYANEDFKFSKSSVSVKLFTESNLYVSRSQAKRLLHSLEEFEEIILDFKDVATIGQAFADEIFRVFKNDHPEIKIAAINVSENVDFMIKRVRLESNADH